MQLVQELDEDGRPIGYILFVDGKQEATFGPHELDEALRQADNLINPPTPKP